MKKIKLSTAVALIVLSIITTVNAMIIINQQLLENEYSEYLVEKQEVSKLYELMNIVEQNFIGEVDKAVALDGAAAGYISGLGDKWSYYLSKEQYQAYLDSMQDNLVGIGINVTYDTENEAIFVINVYSDSPAEDIGIQKLDYITAVNGSKISDIGYAEAVDMIRGEENTMVTLTVLRKDEEFDLIATRANVRKVSISYEMIEEKIGYIKISEFDANTAVQFIDAIEKLQFQGAKGFIFDVRNNPGGLLTELIDTLDYLLPEGTIISTVSKIGNEKVYTSDSDYLDMPIAVLMNESSVSAAEFFAAAIKDYKVGVLVGENSMGKGYTQQPQQLSDGSAIILSVNKYYTPNGQNLADIGVTPDILIALSSEEKTNFHYLTNETDPQIVEAVRQVELKILE